MEALRETLSAENGQLSSKRVMGVLAIVSIIGIYIYCGVTSSPMPDCTGELLLASTALLGVDSVTRVFTNKQSNEKD